MNDFFGSLYKECPLTLEGYGRNQHKLTKNRGFSENLSYKSKIFRGFLEMLCGCMDISRFHRRKNAEKSKGVTIGHALKMLLRGKTARKGNAVHIAAVGAQVDFVAPYGAAVDGGVNVPGNAVVFVQIHPAKGFPHTKGGKNSALPKQGPHVVEPCFFVTEFQYQGEIIPGNNLCDPFPSGGKIFRHFRIEAFGTIVFGAFAHDLTSFPGSGFYRRGSIADSSCLFTASSQLSKSSSCRMAAQPRSIFDYNIKNKIKINRIVNLPTASLGRRTRNWNLM